MDAASTARPAAVRLVVLCGPLAGKACMRPVDIPAASGSGPWYHEGAWVLTREPGSKLHTLLASGPQLCRVITLGSTERGMVA